MNKLKLKSFIFANAVLPASGFALPVHAEDEAQLIKQGEYLSRLNDDEVVQLATFIRQGWGNTAPAVSKDQVAEVRKRLK